jgi:SAM-dependent methyltransferase/uncharacterized protein YbaR (Trm112 family)
MRASFLPYLQDPATGEALALEVTKEESGDVREGFLVSPSNRYPIVRGVPRFAGYKDDSNYAKSFGYQWNKWSLIQFERDNKGRPMEGHTRRMWERIAGRTDVAAGSVVADYGCGPGRFVDIARDKGARVIGLDLSDAVEAAGEIFASDPQVLICQADILRSPLKAGSMDGTFSIGVLHHTPDARKGFADMVRATKQGGWVAVSVYTGGGYYGGFITQLYRRFFKALWPILGHYPPLVYSYAVIYLSRPLYWERHIWALASPILGYFPMIQLKDIRWSVLDTFDSVTPSNQNGFSLFEVFGWAREEGLSDIMPSNWGGASFNAKK